MIAPLTLLLILAPPALVHLRGARTFWVMASGLVGLALFGLALWLTLSGWPRRPPPVGETYFVVAQWHAVFVLGAVIAAVLIGQWVKTRRGVEDRRPTLAFFWLMLIGMTATLSPLARPVSPTMSQVSSLGALAALVGLVGLVFLILVLPLWRRLRGRG
ncbi:MAG: hypothetical protein VX874_11265 [Pseudomonadota bacterium]|nr:hypothetical protein [Pseudomonadota bacterium]